MSRIMIGLSCMAAALATAAVFPASAVSAQADRYAGFDQLRDTYVRDGGVYYKALRADRARLDRFVQGLNLDPAELMRWTIDERKAFWLNAYEALVLKTVIDAYPIRGNAPAYPRNSIRQVPGAFDRMQHPVAGQRLTLDAMESRMASEFSDARMLLALGRGAVGGGRLRSEVYRADALNRQLDEVVKECAGRTSCVSIDLASNVVTISPLFGWHSAVFERSFGPAAEGRWPMRSGIERAVAAMVYPFMFSRERELLGADAFQLKYGQFDWSLNEL